jgi:hypothetical protein
VQDHRGTRQRVINIRPRTALFVVAGVVVLYVVLRAIGVGDGSSDWYANGKTWAMTDDKADYARLIGPASLVTKWCTDNIDSGNSASQGIAIPYNAPSLNDQGGVNSWVRGCVAGYWHDHPDQPTVGGMLQGYPARLQRVNWYSLGKTISADAKTNGMNSTYGGATATTAKAKCADLLFIHQPSYLAMQITSHEPRNSTESIAWTRGCEAGFSGS